MSDSNNADTIKRAAAHRRGVKPGDKVINRGGGGVAPSSIVTSQRKIVGIKNAMLSAMREDPLMFEIAINLEIALKFKDPKWRYNLSDDEQVIFDQAIERAKTVKDWVKLPREELGDEFFIEEAKPKPRQRQP
ncbi:MAG: hypothetical protein WAS27_00890 [Candidatus Saccharimonadales bacterium]